MKSKIKEVTHKLITPSGDDLEESLASARLRLAAPDLLHMLYTALPFIEDAKNDPCYKPGAVAKVERDILAVLAKAVGEDK